MVQFDEVPCGPGVEQVSEEVLCQEAVQERRRDSNTATKSVGGNTSNSSSITSIDNSSFSDPQVTLSKAVAHWWIHAMIFHGVRVEAKPAPLRLHSRPAHGSRTTLAAMPAQVQTKE